MSIRLIVAGGLSAMLIATPSVAADRNGFAALNAHDYVAAEKRIAAERRIHPQRPELMLNLAAVYRNTGREQEAKALYRDVLARPSVDLDLPSGTSRSSYDLATAGLRQLASLEIVQR